MTSILYKTFCCDCTFLLYLGLIELTLASYVLDMADSTMHDIVLEVQRGLREMH